MLSVAWRAGLKSWQLPLLLALTSSLLALADVGVDEALRYHREAILHGQVWRLLSAHLLHLGWSHLLLNLCGLALVWALFVDELAGAFGWVVLLGSALGVGLGLLRFDPGLEWYVGLSGVLHGLFVAGALRRWPEQRLEASVMLAVVAGKLLWEQVMGPMPGTSAISGGNVIVDAHLFGAVGGCLAALLWGVKIRTRKRTLLF